MATAMPVKNTFNNGGSNKPGWELTRKANGIRTKTERDAIRKCDLGFVWDEGILPSRRMDSTSAGMEIRAMNNEYQIKVDI